MSVQTTIRPARPADIGAIRALARRAWDATYEDLLDETTVAETVAEWYADDALREALDTPGTAFLVAEAGEDLLGFCHGVVLEDEGDVLRMYVDPDHWGEGVGTALHERLRDDLLDFNMRRMRAIVLADNDIGNEFYRGLGFEKTGEGDVELGGETYTENVYTKEFDRE
ncbi:GNAT family N-acetyltransferase [Halobium salinum]|uniref:GNAT family N-acetyltransferase n=1 Tax=Halobium salinum TaxID=1364940 RepID=A0ABD5PFX4_9EURY|nr:GNAT family N-acetyltransferase [Halobium salinum]